MRLRNANAAPTQSVSRALAILGQFESGQPRRRVSEVARDLGVSASTASRLLFSLQREGFVEYDAHTGQYGLGLELVTLASRALNGNELYRVAVGDLAMAADEFDMTVNLSIMRHDQLFYLAVVEPPATMTPISLIGEHGALHSTAMGVVLLAGLPVEEREEVMARISYPQFTPNTVSGPDELRAKVEFFAERGYAIDREEGALGRGCVATGIRAASGSVVAACSLNGPMTVMDLDRRAPQLGARMIEVAEQISRKLGYRMGSGTHAVRNRPRAVSGVP